MKAMRISLTVGLLVSSGQLAQADTASVGTGNWNVSGTWNNGLPVNGQKVYIVNGNTVTFQAGDTYSGGSTFAYGLTIGEKPYGSGTLTMTGGTLNSGGLVMAHETNATLNISGGTFNADGDMFLGWDYVGTPSRGSAINVSGGTLNMKGSTANYNIGQGIPFDVNISGSGTVNVERAVNIYMLSPIKINGANAAMNIKTGGAWNCRGAAVDWRAGLTRVENGGSINQSGGTAVFGNDDAGTLWLGASGTAGIYNLSGGTWTQNGYLRMGVGSSGNGVINQTGGTFELNNSVEVWGSSQSTYTLAGGTFRSGSVAAEAYGAVTNGKPGSATVNNYSGGFRFNITGGSGDVTLDMRTNIAMLGTSLFTNSAATLTKKGPGNISLTGASAQLQLKLGRFVMEEGTFETQSSFVVGQGGTNTATLKGGTLRTGYIDASNMVIGFWHTSFGVTKASVNGTLVQTGGTIDVGPSANMTVGSSGGSGSYILSNGVCSASGRTLYVGISGGGQGILRVEGGSLTASNLRVCEGDAASGSVTVNGGTVSVTNSIYLNTNGRLDIGAANNAFTNTTTTLILNGGILGLDLKGAGNTMGRMSLTANSTLTIGSKSGCLTFTGDQSGLDWGTKTLTITGPLGYVAPSCLRFSHANRLTAAQLNLITCNGKRVLMDASGYLLEPAPGTLIRFY